jgi:signal transduction histidine kinase
MSDAKKESDRRKAELELRRLMGSTQPTPEEMQAYLEMQDKIDQQLFGDRASLDTDSPSKEPSRSEDDTSPGGSEKP